MNQIVEKLSAVRDNTQNFHNKDLTSAKEEVYTQIETLIHNCEKVELGFDILVGHKFAKYMHLAYSLLLSINDPSNGKYKSLVLKLNKLNKFCKEKVVSFVSIFNIATFKIKLVKLLNLLISPCQLIIDFCLVHRKTYKTFLIFQVGPTWSRL